MDINVGEVVLIVILLGWLLAFFCGTVVAYILNSCR